MAAGPFRRCLATFALRRVRVRVRVLGGMLVVRLLFVFVLGAWCSRTGANVSGAVFISEKESHGEAAFVDIIMFICRQAI